MDDHKRTVAGLFGRAAAGYDQVGFFHQVAQRLLVLAGVDQGMRVLDVACGTGAVLVQAARLVGPTGLAVGIDLAETMVAVAARRLQQQGQDQAAVAVMDAERLGLGAARFDAVCCASAIYLLGDQTGAVRNWMQLLRPGGTLAISEFGDLDARWAWKDELLRRFGPPWSRWVLAILIPSSCSGCCDRPVGAGSRSRSSGWTWSMSTPRPGGRSSGSMASGDPWSRWTPGRWPPIERRRSPRSRPAGKPMGRCTGGQKPSTPSPRCDEAAMSVKWPAGVLALEAAGL